MSPLPLNRPQRLGGNDTRGRIGAEVYGDRGIPPRDVSSRKLSVPNAEPIFYIRHALGACGAGGTTPEEQPGPAQGARNSSNRLGRLHPPPPRCFPKFPFHRRAHP